MTAFTFDPADHRDTFAERGWVHVRGGVAPGLLAELQEMLERSRAHNPLRGQGLAGEKQQHLFTAADMDGFLAELFDAASTMCGLRRERLTLSERHLKVYDADADPDPSAHKDRFASQISIGLSIEVPEGSRLLLWPDVERDHNRFLTTEHRQRLEPHRQPDVALRGKIPMEIADAPGDLVAFHGSSMWHLRRRSAGAALLYLKCNDFDCDPLGEDPTTLQRRARTLELVVAGDVVLAGVAPVPSRRLQSITVEEGRDGGRETWLTVFGKVPARITDAEAELVRAADGSRTVAELAPDRADRAALVRLAQLEAIDLLERPYESIDATASAMASVDAAVGSPGAALRS